MKDTQPGKYYILSCGGGGGGGGDMKIMTDLNVVFSVSLSPTAPTYNRLSHINKEESFQNILIL